MPDTAATRAVVTATYNKWGKRKTQFENKEPGITEADVVTAHKAMSAAIREWEKPGPNETSKVAKLDRKSKRKSWWPKFR